MKKYKQQEMKNKSKRFDSTFILHEVNIYPFLNKTKQKSFLDRRNSSLRT